ncbi:MAG: class I mannose-6-phosphate isomerase [Eubacteriales bacterium]
MKDPIKELPTFTYRTYKGGKLMREFLGEPNAEDTFQPEDWISSFVAAKNRVVIENEGITRVISDGKERLITDVVDADDFGQGRKESGVLIKFLDSAERLGIQVHPTVEFANKYFSSPFGKTECWHILGTRSINGQEPCIYMGFKEHVTREIWKDLFERQDIEGMLAAMHKFTVKDGDTILVRSGTPHAIGAGCFMLEIQEPTDFTMRVEKTTVAGEVLTPMQIHYGIGEDAMLDCFNYDMTDREQVKKSAFLSSECKDGVTELVRYDDTSCFALKRFKREEYSICSECFLTVIVIGDGGKLCYDGAEENIKRGEKYFIPANTSVKFLNTEAIICYPPKC